jgi:hypothetical protein
MDWATKIAWGSEAATQIDQESTFTWNTGHEHRTRNIEVNVEREKKIWKCLGFILEKPY